MSKHHKGTVQSITPLLSDIFKVCIKLDEMPEIKPGQFLNVKIPCFTLRRPFGISGFDAKTNTVEFCFQIRGKGTKAMTQLKVGATLDLLLPLGNGFPQQYKKVMLVGGGIGAFPLLTAAKNSYAFLGFRNKESVVMGQDFKRISKELTIITEGFVTDNILNEYNRIKPDAIFACGPHSMFKSLKKALEGIDIPIYISMEERMACGFGACICCTVDTTHGKSRVCCEGPVFLLSEVIL